VKTHVLAPLAASAAILVACGASDDAASTPGTTSASTSTSGSATTTTAGTGGSGGQGTASGGGGGSGGATGSGGASPLGIDLVAIPAGSFVMGDHSGFVDPKHPSDEVPLHDVSVRAFSLARTETSCADYLVFLEAALAAGEVAVQGAAVVSTADGEILCDTADAPAPSCVTFGGGHFGVAAGRDRFPMSGVRFRGAAAFANWYGGTLGLAPCYDLAAGTTDWTVRCVRLPTEAEWEYAARGGLHDPYFAYPWGDDVDMARANFPESGDPWEQGPEPRTTPVGFFDGSVRKRADFGWPAAMESFATHDGRNGFGLHDTAGNVWELVNDWYGRDYYAKSPAADPPGPDAGDPMPDGKPYKNLRGGSYFNSTKYPGDHERVSNRDPAYFRGKYQDQDDPNGPWFHIGFRVALQER
jgi:formylglycine-generating enzyme required for sulfatase activity